MADVVGDPLTIYAQPKGGRKERVRSERIDVAGHRVDQPVDDPYVENDPGDITISDIEDGSVPAVVLMRSTTPPNLRVSGELRSVVTHYPGNSKASVQIMGTKEEPIELEGRFRDVWMGARGAAQLYAGHLRNMYLAQHYCELSWGSTVVRRGYLRRVELDYTRTADITYKLSFEVVEADEATFVAPKPFPTPVTLDVAKALRQAYWELNALDIATSAINTIAALVPSTAPTPAVILPP